MKNYKILMILLIFNFNLIASDGVFFLPFDSQKLLRNLDKKLNSAKSSIYVTSYIFTHKEIAKKLQKASQRGVQIKILSASNSNEYSQIGNLAKIENIECKIFLPKMHLNFITIDENIIMFGSLSFTKSAFNESYEFFYIKDDVNLTKKFKNYFETLYQEAEFY